MQFIGVTERGNEICLVTEYISGNYIFLFFLSSIHFSSLGGTLRKLLKDRTVAIPWYIRVQV